MIENSEIGCPICIAPIRQYSFYFFSNTCSFPMIGQYWAIRCLFFCFSQRDLSDTGDDYLMETRFFTLLLVYIDKKDGRRLYTFGLPRSFADEIARQRLLILPHLCGLRQNRILIGEGTIAHPVLLVKLNNDLRELQSAWTVNLFFQRNGAVSAQTERLKRFAFAFYRTTFLIRLMSMSIFDWFFCHVFLLLQ